MNNSDWLIATFGYATNLFFTLIIALGVIITLTANVFFLLLHSQEFFIEFQKMEFYEKNCNKKMQKMYLLLLQI